MQISHISTSSYTAFSNTCRVLVYQITKNESFLNLGFRFFFPRQVGNAEEIKDLDSVSTFIFGWLIHIQLNKQVIETNRATTRTPDRREYRGRCSYRQDFYGADFSGMLNISPDIQCRLKSTVDLSSFAFY